MFSPIMGDEKRTVSAPRTVVEDGAARRPFMRGIMVHSLLARGANFEDAYRSASTIRDRLRGRAVVRRDELAEMVDALFGDTLEPRPLALPRPIVVQDAAGHAPFSKGVLAQSLLAAAIAPEEAFELAQQTEARLHAEGRRQIERDTLRELVYETLKSTRSARAAERYRVWRRFADADKPMILLIGGAAGVGKTSLAQEVAHRLGIARVISSDAIRQVMRVMLSRELAPAIHASSYDAHRVVVGIEPARDPVVEAFRSQATSVSIGVRATIGRAIEEGQSMILEGVSALPDLIDLAMWRDAAHLTFLTVATFEQEAFERRFKRRASGGTRHSTHHYLENLDAILRIQDHILELADHFEVPIVENTSFDDSVLSILRHVTGSIRKQMGEGS